jgi:hypothetical protein
MTHPLDGAWLKVVRAQEHLESLNKEIRRYLRTDPYHVPLERQGDLVTANAAIKEGPPPLLSCIIGDCATNLRASLDYIAWELGTKRPTRSLTDSEERHITFPIFDDAKKFPDANGVKHLAELCAVPTTAMSVIESVQPYHAGYQLLGYLPILVNEDKHRALLLCAGNIQGLGKVEIIQGNRRWFNPGGIGLTLNLKASGPSPSAKAPVSMNVEGQATIFVTFQNPRMPQLPADLLLREMIKCVVDIIPRFEPFFRV